ncbi:MAG: hypothetical protein GKS05_13335 [Nitrospirales bacterium]|nr:hypothetical protein [Nitrospirales bacterium]NKB82837.1 hypothetical protein [Nitrospirales bacterium]
MRDNRQQQRHPIQLTSGYLAATIGFDLETTVLRSAGGYYLGTSNEMGPVSRESMEYWKTYAEAARALAGSRNDASSRSERKKQETDDECVPR